MKIESNYSITRLFTSKDIDIVCTDDNNKMFKFRVKLRPIKDFYEDEHWNITYHLLANPNYKKLLLLKDEIKMSQFESLKFLIFELGAFDKYREFYTILLEQLPLFISGFKIDNKTRELKINNVTITEEIWEYILYLLKLSYGEKVEKPLTFDSEEARQFYLAQKAQEEKIAALKAKNPKQTDENGLMKMMLSITYAFPSITIDYLWEQTMAQIHWLQKYAAGAMSYEVNAQAFAAGNVKKGKKLDFFIK